MRAAVAVVGLMLALAATASASADGEAGVVIDFGDGRVETACIPFEGDGISGEELLARGQRAVDQFAGLVCSIDETGCQSSGSFDSCLCQCEGNNCTSWSFFTLDYGETEWRYSSLGFRALEAGDGDVHGWRWGQGTAASAPGPPLHTFEQICGHPPLSLATPTSTPTATPVPATATATATLLPPTTTAVPATAAPSATVAAEPTLPASTGTPTLIETATPDAPGQSPTEPAEATADEPATAPATETPESTSEPTVVPSLPPAATPDSEAGGESDDGGAGAFVAFGGVGALLVAAIVGALILRQRRGGAA